MGNVRGRGKDRKTERTENGAYLKLLKHNFFGNQFLHSLSIFYDNFKNRTQVIKPKKRASANESAKLREKKASYIRKGIK